MRHVGLNSRLSNSFRVAIAAFASCTVGLAAAQEVAVGTVSSGAAMDAGADTIFNIGQVMVGLSSNDTQTMHAGVIPCLGEGGGGPFTIMWTGDGDATSWHDPANWDLNRVPGPGDDVGIPDVPATTVVVYSSGETSINSLTSQEAFQLAGGTLTIDDVSVIGNDFTQTGGTLTGAGDLSVAGSMTWNDGTMSGAGTTTIEAGATPSMGTTGTKYLKRTLDNHGTADWTGGQWRFTDGTFNASANQSTSYSGGTSAFNNDGQFNHTGTATTTFSYGVVFNNDGTVEVQSGVLSFSADYTQTAGATILNGGDLVKTGTPLDIQGGLLTGDGAIAGDVENSGGQAAPGLSGPGIIDLNGDYTQTGDQNADGVLAVQLGGYGQGTEYDLLTVTGTASLSRTLTIELIGGFRPIIGDTFEILTADTVTGMFDEVILIGFPARLDVEVIYSQDPDSVILEVVEAAPNEFDSAGEVVEPTHVRRLPPP